MESTERPIRTVVTTKLSVSQLCAFCKRSLVPVANDFCRGETLVMSIALCVMQRRGACTCRLCFVDVLPHAAMRKKCKGYTI